MPERSKGPEITDKMKESYRRDAEIQYNGKSKEYLEKEQQRLTRDKGPIGWLWEKLGSFVNMVKITVMSVVLGRQETAKRIAAGTRAEEFENAKVEAQKQEKLNVIKEKLKEMEPQEEKEELSKEQGDTPEQGANDPQEQNGAEPTHTDEKQDEEKTENNKGNQKETEKDDLDEELKDDPKYQTIFAQQVHSLTEPYKNGLADFLEQQTGINKSFITIRNDKSVPGIIVEFDKRIMKEGQEKSGFSAPIIVDHYGRISPNNNISRMVGQSVIHYTSRHRESKNKNTKYPGTRPSEKDVQWMVKDFSEKIKQNENNGILTTFAVYERYGQKIEFTKDGKNLSVCIGGLDISINDGRFDEKLVQDAYKKLNQDPIRIQETAMALHEHVKQSVEPNFYKCYTEVELDNLFAKRLEDFSRDNNTQQERQMYLHGHEIKFLFNQDHKITDAALDGVSIYDSTKDTNTYENDQKRREQIARTITDNIRLTMEQEGHYTHTMTDRALQWDEKGHDSAEDHTTPGVSELTADGTLPAIALKYTEQGLEKLFEEKLSDIAEKKGFSNIFEFEGKRFVVSLDENRFIQSVSIEDKDGCIWESSGGIQGIDEIAKAITDEVIPDLIFSGQCEVKQEEIDMIHETEGQLNGQELNNDIKEHHDYDDAGDINL